MEFTKEEMLDIVSSVETEYDNMIKAEKESQVTLAKNEDGKDDSGSEGKDLQKYEYTAEDMEKMYGEMDKAEASDHYNALKKVIAKTEIENMEKKEAASEQDKISKMEMEKKEKEAKDKKDKEDKDKNKDKKDKEDMEKKEYMDKKEKEYMDKKEAASQQDTISKSEKEITQEAEIADLKTKNEALEAEKVSFLKKAEEDETVQKEFGKFIKLLEGDEEAPSQKSITSMDYIAKNEDGSEKEPEVKTVESLSKTEVSDILAKKSADPATSIKDRKAINSYILENTNISEIKHLLQGE